MRTTPRWRILGRRLARFCMAFGGIGSRKAGRFAHARHTCSAAKYAALLVYPAHSARRVARASFRDAEAGNGRSATTSADTVLLTSSKVHSVVCTSSRSRNPA
jgi:hypothetical protein